MDTIAPVNETVARPLARNDLDAVVAIDARLEGRTRRAYFERRLAYALREPSLHLQYAIDDDEGLAGYLLGRIADGDFGRAAPAVRLETIGVRPDAKGRNVGGRLLDALVAKAGKRGIRELRTTARWNDHSMLRWLDEHGFTLAPNHVVERLIDASASEAAVDGPVVLAEGRGPGREIDYGAPEGNDYERLARDSCEIRAMTPDDLQEVARIDRAITGRERTGFVESPKAYV